MILMDDYDTQCKAIDKHNKPLLDGFATWMIDSGLSAKTVRNHVDNINFFSTFLVSNEELKRLDEADESDIRMFLGYWFQRKAMWSSVESTKSNIASFKKFYKWMRDRGAMPSDVVDDILITLKEDREEFLAAADGKSFYE
jgi:site-specific recombinase XerD